MLKVPPTSPARTHHNVTLAVLVAGGISYALMQSLVIPALPEIRAELGASQTSISWMLTAFLLSASVATPIVGRLGDMYGKRKLLIVTLVLLTIGTVMSAAASSMGLLILGRVVQGIGGGIFPLAFGIIRDEFPRQKVSHGIGLMSSLLGVGGGLGVILAGPIVDGLSYHFLFWIPFVLIAATTIATWKLVPESPVTVPGKVNWLAAALMSAGLVLVLVTITKGSDWGWASGRTLGGLAAGAVVLAAWVRREVRSETPLVDMRMMRVHGVWTTNVVAFLVGVGMYSSFILVPQFVQEPESTGYGFGASVLAAGVFLIPATITQVLVGQFAGRIEQKVGSKVPLLVGSAFTGAAFVLLIVDRSQAWEVYVASAMLGTGIGLAFAALANLIVENVRQDQTGVATGMNTVMRTLGGAVGGQVAAALLAANLGAGGAPTSGGYGWAFAMCAAALAVAVVVGLLVPGRPRAPRRGAVPVTA